MMRGAKAERNAPFAEIDMGGTLAVHVQGPGRARELEDDAFERRADALGSDADAPGVREGGKGILREDRAEEFERVVGLVSGSGGGNGPFTHALFGVVWGEWRGRHLGRRGIVDVSPRNRDGVRAGGGRGVEHVRRRLGRRGGWIYDGIFEAF